MNKILLLVVCLTAQPIGMLYGRIPAGSTSLMDVDAPKIQSKVMSKSTKHTFWATESGNAAVSQHDTSLYDRSSSEAVTTENGVNDHANGTTNSTNWVLILIYSAPTAVLAITSIALCACGCIKYKKKKHDMENPPKGVNTSTPGLEGDNNAIEMKDFSMESEKTQNAEADPCEQPEFPKTNASAETQTDKEE